MFKVSWMMQPLFVQICELQLAVWKDSGVSTMVVAKLARVSNPVQLHVFPDQYPVSVFNLVMLLFEGLVYFEKLCISFSQGLY
jgi:uncharacterized protein with PQ loop repeat